MKKSRSLLRQAICFPASVIGCAVRWHSRFDPGRHSILKAGVAFALIVQLQGCVPTLYGVVTPSTPLEVGYEAIRDAARQQQIERRGAVDRPIAEADSKAFGEEIDSYLKKSGNIDVRDRFRAKLLWEKQIHTYQSRFDYDRSLYWDVESQFGDEISNRQYAFLARYSPVRELQACSSLVSRALNQTTMSEFLSAADAGDIRAITYAVDAAVKYYGEAKDDEANDKPGQSQFIDLYVLALKAGDPLAAYRLHEMNASGLPADLQIAVDRATADPDPTKALCALYDWTQIPYDPASQEQRQAVFAFVRTLSLPAPSELSNETRNTTYSNLKSVFNSHRVRVD